MTERSDLPLHPFTRFDAAALGHTQRDLEVACRNGTLIRWARGVYGRSDAPDSVDTRAQVIALAASDHHVITDRTAAWLHGVDMLTMSEHDLLPPTESCAVRGRNPTRRPEADGRTRESTTVSSTTRHRNNATPTATDATGCVKPAGRCSSSDGATSPASDATAGSRTFARRWHRRTPIVVGDKPQLDR